MPLNKPILKSGIQALLTEMRTKEENSDEYFADKLADVIDQYVKTGTVTIQSGIAVTTNTGAGATTAPGTGTIS